MIEVANLPQLAVILPLIVLVGSWVVSKVLRLSFALVAIGALLPIGLPFVELPFEAQFVDQHPLLVMGAGWLVLLALLIGWVVARPVAGAALKGVGPLRFLYLVGMCLALVVVALLIAQPAVLEAYAPGWRGPAGVTLLCVSCLSMALALLRAMRAAAVCVVWAAVSIVLASEIFLNKLPNEIVREDLRQLEEYLPADTLGKTIDDLAKGLASSPAEKVRALVLGESGATGFPFTQTQGLSGQLKAEFERAGGKIEINDLSLERATIMHTRRLAEKVAQSHSDLVLIAGWAADRERGVNSYGLTGLSEREAEQVVARRASLRSYPLVASVLDSRLYKYTTGLWAREPKLQTQEVSQRVPPAEYEAELAATVDAFIKGGSTVVLVPEPALADPVDAAYREAMTRVAKSSGAVFLDAPAVLSTQSGNTLFARGRMVASEGYRALARATVNALRDESVLERSSPALKAALTGYDMGTFPTGDPRFSGLVGEPVRMLVKPSEVDGDLVFKLRALEEGTRYYRVVFSVDGRFVADRRTDSREGTRVRFQLPEEVRGRPLVEIALRTIASPPPDEDLIGASSFSLPSPVAISLQPGGATHIQVGEAGFSSINRFTAAAVDPRSGDILSVMRENDPKVFSRWLRSQPWGTMVAAAGRINEEADVAGALKYMGVRFVGPTFASVGICGASEGGSIVQSTKAPNTVHLSGGSPLLERYQRFVLEEAWIGDRPLLAPSAPQVGETA